MLTKKDLEKMHEHFKKRAKMFIENTYEFSENNEQMEKMDEGSLENLIAEAEMMEASCHAYKMCQIIKEMIEEHYQSEKMYTAPDASIMGNKMCP